MYISGYNQYDISPRNNESNTPRHHPFKARLYAIWVEHFPFLTIKGPIPNETIGAIIERATMSSTLCL